MSLLISLSFGLAGCANSVSSTDEDTLSGGPSLGKADITVGPIEALSCRVESAFVRRGSFAKVEVDARDAKGDASRNYSLEVTPASGARVVQRNQVIFSLDGLYQVNCCAHDVSSSGSKLCDSVAIRVGESAPALSVLVPPFSEGQAQLTGQAVDRLGKPASVAVNGLEVPSDERGRFSLNVPVTSGLNRYEVIARDGEGSESTRRAWTLGGPFLDVDSIDPAATRLRISPSAYPEISRVLTELLKSLLDQYAASGGFQQRAEGSTLGYSWEVTPFALNVEQTRVMLTQGQRDDDLALHVTLDGFEILADGKTRFAAGGWRERDVSISAHLDITVQLHPHANGLDVGEVKADVQGLDVEISDMPSFLEGVLEFFFEGTIQRELMNVVESVGDQGLSDVLTGFEVNEEVKLPEPLSTQLEMTGRIIELEASARGLLLSLGLSVDGETDPARVDAPGPVRVSGSPARLEDDAPYEFALHLDFLHRLLFATWQTGGLDFIQTVERPIGDQELLRDEQLTLFITPQLLPVIRAGERSGELVISLGGLLVDGVLESELGVLNCALEVGVTFNALLSAQGDVIFTSSALSAIDVDVLIAPAGWEVEPTRAMIERVLARDVLPKYAEVLSSLPIPSVDLTEFNLEGINALKVSDVALTTSESSLSVSANLTLD